MNERYYQLNGLSVDKTLELLTEFVESSRSSHSAQVLQSLYVATSNLSGLDVELLLPIPGRFHGLNTPVRDFKTRYQDKLNRRPIGTVTERPDHYKPLIPSLINLIQRTTRQMRGISRAQADEMNGAIEGESLLISKDPSMSIEESFNRLQLDATYVRVAVATTPTQERYHLFHIRDDLNRKSFYQGAKIYFRESIATIPYAVTINNQTYKFFVHNPIQPDKIMLEYLVRLMLASPSAFGAKSLMNESSPDGILGAAYAFDNKDGQFLYLGNVPFFDEVVVGAGQGFTYYGVQSLLSVEEALANISINIPKGTNHEAGYRLQLHPAEYYREAQTNDEMAENEREVERLEREVTKLKGRIVALKNLQMTRRPFLLQFSQSHLRQMIQVLTTCPNPSDIKFINYAYYKPDGDDEPLHFLYIPSDVYRRMRFADLDNSAMVMYWFDPNWSYYYHNRTRARAEVFVPYGYLIHPPLHSWAIEDIDTYLRNVLGDLVQENLHEPIYLFLNVLSMRNSRDEDVRISVLDKQWFKPILKPEIIGWLNDNLILMRHLETMQKSVRDISEQVRREAFYESARKNTHEALALYEQEKARVEGGMTGHMGDMLKRVQVEINDTMSRTEKAIKDAQALNTRLAMMEGLYKTTDVTIKATEEEIEATRKTVQTVAQRVNELREKVETTIRDAQKTKAEKDAQVKKAVEDLLRTHSELKREINRLKSIL